MENRIKHYLNLCGNPVRFEPVNNINSVFFDESNGQVFTVRSNGTGGVVVKDPKNKDNMLSFRLEDKGEIMCIKLSQNSKVLAIQRSLKSVDFINIIHGLDTIEYSQTCKGKTSKILGFFWTGIYEFVIVTDHGVELYQVFPDKKCLKILRSFSLSINWFIYLSKNNSCLVSTSPLSNVLYLLIIKQGSIIKLPKLELELPPPDPSLHPGSAHLQSRLNQQPLPIKQKDVMLFNLYGDIYIINVAFGFPSYLKGVPEIALYKVKSDGTIIKSDVLDMRMSGKVVLNTIDNVIIVHHQTSKTSLLFDINLDIEDIKLSQESRSLNSSNLLISSFTQNLNQRNEFHQQSSHQNSKQLYQQIITKPVVHHSSVLQPMSIEPIKIGTTSLPSKIGKESYCDLYSVNWAIFSPDIVLDATIGYYWNLELNIENLTDLIQDKCLLIGFLLLREDSKKTISDVLKNLILYNSFKDHLNIKHNIEDSNKKSITNNKEFSFSTENIMQKKNSENINFINKNETISNKKDLYNNGNINSVHSIDNAEYSLDLINNKDTIHNNEDKLDIEKTKNISNIYDNNMNSFSTIEDTNSNLEESIDNKISKPYYKIQNSDDSDILASGSSTLSYHDYIDEELLTNRKVQSPENEFVQNVEINYNDSLKIENEISYKLSNKNKEKRIARLFDDQSIDLDLNKKDIEFKIKTEKSEDFVEKFAIDLSVIGGVFDKINRVYAQNIIPEPVNIITSLSSITIYDSVNKALLSPLINQIDMYQFIFSRLQSDEIRGPKYFMAIMTEYLLSLSNFQIPIEETIENLIFTYLNDHQCYSELHQFLQFFVIPDSKKTAVLLLLIENPNIPSEQIATRILKRLVDSNSSELILEVLLGKKLIIEALRFAIKTGLADLINPRRFLDAAYNSKDDTTFYMVHNYLQEWNLKIKGSNTFQDEKCYYYTDYFNRKFT